MTLFEMMLNRYIFFAILFIIEWHVCNSNKIYIPFFSISLNYTCTAYLPRARLPWIDMTIQHV